MATRRSFLKAASATGIALTQAGYLRNAVAAAEFRFKYGNYQPDDHPITIRMKEAADKIRADTKGRVDIQVFSNSQLGSDTDMLSQLRVGAIDLMSLSPLTLGIFVPAAQLNGIGFAFASYDQVWSAMDGDLGSYVRGEIAKTPIFAFEKIWDNGYRQITTSTHPIVTPDNLKGTKMRVPPSPLWTSMFKALGASPATIGLQDVYMSLQTKVVDGQENPLVLISTGKFYEVQKYCSITNHMWDGFWLLGSKRSFVKLPPDLQEIVRTHLDAAALKQREDVRHLNDSLVGTLKAKGLQFNTVNPQAFRDKLRSAGFYVEWRNRFGNDAWAVLEKYTGKLA
jgi:tripartite ATP-independent transporter DctP family solute receptor